MSLCGTGDDTGYEPELHKFDMLPGLTVGGPGDYLTSGVRDSSRSRTLCIDAVGWRQRFSIADMNSQTLFKTLLIFLLALPVSCSDLQLIWDRKESNEVDLGIPASGSGVSAVLRDTIGAKTYLEGMSPLRVLGYGLVVGLGKNGSTECPKHIFQQLVRQMYQQSSFSTSEVGVKSITPEEIINSLDSAVVIVRAQIPAGATVGTKFDVAVRALPGTQTTSLQGGTLFPTDLELFRELDGRGTTSGLAHARAAGPVMVNPFASEDAATDVTTLEGIVLAGGVAVKSRKVRLVLVQASHQAARRIQERVNTRFSEFGNIANAISPSFVELLIPPKYGSNVAHFLGLVRGLFQTGGAQLDTVRAEKLARALIEPTSPHAELSFSLEAIGTAALPSINKLYDHSLPHANYYAAATGLRLGDHLAVDNISRHARDPASEFQFLAIRALGEAKDIGATGHILRELLAVDDPRVRIAAYEALVERRDAVIHSTTIGGDNYVMDMVPCDPPNFVYVKRAGARRIALFGYDLKCEPPLLYRAPDGRFTVTAQPDDEQMTVLRRLSDTTATSPPLPVPYELARFVAIAGQDAEMRDDGTVLGLSLDYGEVVRALCYLCQDRSINAAFMLEQPNVAELFGPPREVGRPESDF